ncbi:hypothetical protein MC75_000335 [Klebsiella pneumoniae]|nr:hypothetical protein [Klebsiella quasipneumoniae]PNO88063.1 hypothetical protein MC75_000335 [Klebsiella pneumoniae]PXL47341.1 hypothetical protein DMS35_29230 [Klebsiella variicola]
MFTKLSAISLISGLLTTVVHGSRFNSLTNCELPGNDSNLLIVFYVQIMPDDFVMQLHRF